MKRKNCLILLEININYDILRIPFHLLSISFFLWAFIPLISNRISFTIDWVINTSCFASLCICIIFYFTLLILSSISTFSGSSKSPCQRANRIYYLRERLRLHTNLFSYSTTEARIYSQCAASLLEETLPKVSPMSEMIKFRRMILVTHEITTNKTYSSQPYESVSKSPMFSLYMKNNSCQKSTSSL